MDGNKFIVRAKNKAVVNGLIITVVQVRGRSQSGPSTQILHRSCIHCEPPITYLPVATRATFSCQRAQAYPLARGHVHITHADDPSAPEDFVPHFFESFVTISLPSCQSHRPFLFF